MPTIKFERVERDCPSNKKMREDYADSKTSPRLIYDFYAMIDGEHRATFTANYRSVGYVLYDAGHRLIKEPGTPYGNEGKKTDPRAVQVRGKAEFEPTLTRLLDAGLIPTLARMAELRAEEVAKAEQRKADEIESNRIGRARRAGPRLLDALKIAVEFFDNNGGDESYSWLPKLKAAIKLAEGGE